MTAGDNPALDVNAVRQRLRDERVDASARLLAMTEDLTSIFAASEDSNVDDEHDPEGQTIAYERAQLTSLIRAARDHVDAIDAAAARLDRGEYGTCEVCGDPIPVARLEVRPTARTCVRHATGTR